MNKKGFTLIELLAVIVILAIIALIATPAVLNIIEDSKESAAKDSAMTIAKAAETYYISNATLQGEEVGTIDLTDDTLEYKGEKPSKGYVEFDNKGNAYLKMYMNGYCVVSDYDNTVVSEKMDSEDCTMASGSTATIEPFNDGDVVFYNPVSNDVCTEGTENCMKWYAFLDTEEATEVRLLLGHNITDNLRIAEADLAIENIRESVGYNWNSEVASTVRMISAYEVHEIAQKNGTAGEDWDVTDGNTWYYFTSGTRVYSTYTNHTLGWLFDKTNGCVTDGCYEDDSSTYGYWTPERYTDIMGLNGWSVTCDGSLGLALDREDMPKNRGVRPVIEVSKTKFAN